MRWHRLGAPTTVGPSKQVNMSWVNERTRLFHDGLRFWWAGDHEGQGAVGIVGEGEFSVVATWDNHTPAGDWHVVARRGRVALVDGDTMRWFDHKAEAGADTGEKGCSQLPFAPNALLADGCGTLYLGDVGRYWALADGFEPSDLSPAVEVTLANEQDERIEGWAIQLVDAHGLIATSESEHRVWLVSALNECAEPSCGWSASRGDSTNRRSVAACVGP